MKKLLLATILLASVSVLPVSAMAGVDIGINISLPPPIVFASPPEVVVLPETYVYVVPDLDVDIFFYDGWWWRPWQGHWYRSRHYDSGWAYYQSVPSFYGGIPSGWRNDYRDHRWGGHQWNYQRIPQQQLQGNWSNWQKSRHWEKQQTWGVQGLKPRTRSQQPSQAVQPKSQAKPQFREATKPQQSRPQSQTLRPQNRVGAKPQQSRTHSREAQPLHAQPLHAQPLHAQPPQAQPQHAQPQQAQPQRSEQQRANPERGGEGRQDRK